MIRRRATQVCLSRDHTQLAAVYNSDSRFLLLLRSKACLAWSGYKSEREAGWGEQLGQSYEDRLSYSVVTGKEYEASSKTSPLSASCSPAT